MLLLTEAWMEVGSWDQIMMMMSMSMVLLSLHLPLYHLHDCCLTAMDWTVMMM